MTVDRRTVLWGGLAAAVLGVPGCSSCEAGPPLAVLGVPPDVLDAVAAALVAAGFDASPQALGRDLFGVDDPAALSSSDVARARETLAQRDRDERAAHRIVRAQGVPFTLTEASLLCLAAA